MIKRIAGCDVREAAAEIGTATGTVGHALTSGAMVQVFLTKSGGKVNGRRDADSLVRTEEQGVRATFFPDLEDGSSP